MKNKKLIAAVAVFMTVSMQSCGNTADNIEHQTKSMTTESIAESITDSREEVISEESYTDSEYSSAEETKKAEFSFYENMTYPVLLKDNGDLYAWEYEITSDSNGVKVTPPSIESMIETGDIPAPKKILENVKEYVIPGNSASNYAVTNNNELYTWGENSYGSLGCGDNEDKAEPVKILDDVREAGYCYAITINDELYLWGHANDNSLYPEKKLDDVISVRQVHFYENGGSSVCFALTKNGDLYSIGGIRESLGVEEYKPFEPNYIMSNVKDYSPSDGFGTAPCSAVTNDGELYVWGKFTIEQSGDMIYLDLGNMDNIQYTPYKIKDNVSALSFDEDPAQFFITNDNDSYKWYMINELSTKISFSKYRTDIASIGNKDYYYKTDGTLVVFGHSSSNGRLISGKKGQYWKLVDGDGTFKLYSNVDNHYIICKPTNYSIKDAGNNYCITSDNKLLFYKQYYDSLTGGGYVENITEIPIPD